MNHLNEVDLIEFASNAINWSLNTQWTDSHLKGFVPKVTFPILKYDPYPEITGYAASLFAKLFKKFGSKDYFERAILAVNALIDLQLPSGGFAHNLSKNSPVFSFDHIIITNALIDCYGISGNEDYLNKAENALDFLISHQGTDGSLPKQLGTDNQPDTHYYLTKGIIPLVKIYNKKSDPKYLNAAKKIATHSITNFQKQDGGFRVDENQPEWNRFHYLCYAVEGLMALYSLDSYFNERTEQAGLYMLKNQREDGALWYSYTNKGVPIPQKVDISATVQAIRIFLSLHQKTSNEKYQEGAAKALNYLIPRQYKNGFKLTNGGLPFGYHRIIDSVGVCSWATQFATDLISYPKGDVGLAVDF